MFTKLSAYLEFAKDVFNLSGVSESKEDFTSIAKKKLLISTKTLSFLDPLQPNESQNESLGNDQMEVTPSSSETPKSCESRYIPQISMDFERFCTDKIILQVRGLKSGEMDLEKEFLDLERVTPTTVSSTGSTKSFDVLSEDLSHNIFDSGAPWSVVILPSTQILDIYKKLRVTPIQYPKKDLWGFECNPYILWITRAKFTQQNQNFVFVNQSILLLVDQDEWINRNDKRRLYRCILGAPFHVHAVFKPKSLHFSKYNSTLKSETAILHFGYHSHPLVRKDTTKTSLCDMDTCTIRDPTNCDLFYSFTPESTRGRPLFFDTGSECITIFVNELPDTELMPTEEGYVDVGGVKSPAFRYGGWSRGNIKEGSRVPSWQVHFSFVQDLDHDKSEFLEISDVNVIFAVKSDSNLECRRDGDIIIGFDLLKGINFEWKDTTDRKLNYGIHFYQPIEHNAKRQKNRMMNKEIKRLNS